MSRPRLRIGVSLALVPVLIACARDGAVPVAPTSRVGGASAGVILNEDLTAVQVFPVDNWWNLDVRYAPVDSASDAILDFISGRTPQNPGATRALHPDFGPPPYGMPYVTVGSLQPLREVTFTLYGDESDAGAPGHPPGYPIPDEAFQLPGHIEGGVPGGGLSGDRHLLLIDRDRGLLFETWYTYWNPGPGRWEAGSGAAFDLATNDRRPEGWTSSDAAGLAVFPGLVRRDEVASGMPIPHAFRFTVRATNGHVWPASHTAGSTPGAPPLGTRLRMKLEVDLSGYVPEV